MKNCDLIYNFCKNFRLIRLSNKLSKKEMARKIGISVYAVRKIESGILPPRLGWKVLLKIYNEFGVLPSAITGRML